jgi:PAS domain S-box-containing protein
MGDLDKNLRAADAILSISADAVISTDEQQNIIRFNRGAEEIFGWTADEIMGKSIDLLIPERFRTEHPRHVRNFAESSVVARRMGERRQISGLRKSGEEFPAEASISKTQIDGTMIFTVVLRDVTERTRLYEEAQAAIRARDDVLAVVSHDLGNPLAAIRLGTTLLLKRIPKDEQKSEAWQHLENIRSSIAQMERLINDLLEIKRIEAGILSLERERVAVSALLTDIADRFETLAASKQLTLRTLAPTVRAYVRADPERILQVLSNLIGNAAKFTPSGGEIIVSAEVVAGNVHFAVKDSGPGIPTEHLPHVFDRFWQARRTGRHGIGLGLAIVKGIVEAHDGAVTVESEPGAGSTFRFTLALAE